MGYNRKDILDWYENRKGKEFIRTYTRSSKIY